MASRSPPELTLIERPDPAQDGTLRDHTQLTNRTYSHVSSPLPNEACPFHTPHPWYPYWQYSTSGVQHMSGTMLRIVASTGANARSLPPVGLPWFGLSAPNSERRAHGLASGHATRFHACKLDRRRTPSHSSAVLATC